MYDTITNPAYLLQLVLSGLSIGSVYALFAVSFVIAWASTSHLNLAAGELGSLGVFTLATLLAAGAGAWLALPLVLAGAALLGAAVHHGLVRHVETKGVFPVVLLTLAIYLVVNAAVGLVWGTQPVPAPRLVPTGPDAQIVLLQGPPQAYLTYGDLASFAVLAIVVGALAAFLRGTRFGLAYRAVAANRESAALAGIPLPRMGALGWALSTVIATLAAVLLGMRNGTLDYTMMTPLLVFGLTAATVGGLESLTGAVVGGFALGLVVNLLPGLLRFVSGDMGLVIALVLVLAVLLLRPQGLFGRTRLERV